MTIMSRIKALEARHSPGGRVVVVTGANDDEQEQQVALVEAVAGKLHSSDLVVRIRRFGVAPYQRPRINGRELEDVA